MMMPPMAMIGAAIIMFSASTTTICTCCTSFVLRVISDGVPKWLTSACEKPSTLRKMAPRTSRPKAMAVFGAPVDGDDGADHQHQGDDQHEAAGPHDVVRVALDDAVVDDVGVEVRQVEVGDRLDEQQADHEDELPPVGRQALPEQPDHAACLGAFLVRVCSFDRAPVWDAINVRIPTIGTQTGRAPWPALSPARRGDCLRSGFGTTASPAEAHDQPGDACEQGDADHCAETTYITTAHAPVALLWP